MGGLDLHHAGPLLTLAVVLAVGVAFGALARRARLPSVTGQVLGGVLIGRAGWDLFGEEPVHGLAPLTHFALGLIAVTVGAHLNVRRLRNAGRRLFLLLLTEATLTPALVFLSTWLLGQRSPREAALYGAIAVATAPATIVAVVKEARAKGVFVKTLVAAVALNNLTCIVLFEGARALVADPHAPATPLSGPLARIGLAAGLGAVLAIGVAVVARISERRQLLATSAVVALLMGVGLATWLKLSPLLTCLALGLVQTNITPTRDKLVDSVFDDFEPVILAIFFTLAGMHLSFDHIGVVGLLAALFLLSRAGGKLLATQVAMRLAGATERVRRHLGLALLPQAGVAIGLVVLVQEDVSDRAMIDLFTAVVLTAVTINELVGPVFTRQALQKSGEAGLARARLVDFLQEENIVVGSQIAAKNQTEAISALVDVLLRSHRLTRVNRDAFLASVLAREAEVSTCLGGGLAIPHGELAESKEMLGAMWLCKEGLAIETPDGRPVHCMVLLATPPGQRQRHLEVLAALARTIGRDEAFKQQLFSMKSAAHAAELLSSKEAGPLNLFLEEA